MRIYLHFSSNVDRYRVFLANPQGSRYMDIEGSRRITVITHFPILQISAIPLTAGSSRIYYTIDARCNECVSLFFRFFEERQPATRYTFYLTDAIYGMPIDGMLNLKKT